MKRVRFVFLSWLLAGAAHAQNADELAIAIAGNDPAKAQDARRRRVAELRERRQVHRARLHVDRVPPFVRIPEADRVEVVRLLISADAQKNRRGADGLMPVDRARKAGSQWAVEALTR